ncbi:hypothetical protein B0H16DRAFT_1748926 [Mycena metata]|uniref:Uncharacterized protein n=1 Tax=Mycena metata TaxID=1033252 RepID=A0AAD7DW09_9AGAR|nr:hypothetical protein B0H16DRAFT_1748926 [Mycena metata]
MCASPRARAVFGTEPAREGSLRPRSLRDLLTVFSLWPLFHYLAEDTSQDTRYAAYAATDQAFAERIKSVCGGRVRRLPFCPAGLLLSRSRPFPSHPLLPRPTSSLFFAAFPTLPSLPLLRYSPSHPLLLRPTSSLLFFAHLLNAASLPLSLILLVTSAHFHPSYHHLLPRLLRLLLLVPDAHDAHDSLVIGLFVRM